MSVRDRSRVRAVAVDDAHAAMPQTKKLEMMLSRWAQLAAQRNVRRTVASTDIWALTHASQDYLSQTRKSYFGYLEEPNVSTQEAPAEYLGPKCVWCHDKCCDDILCSTTVE